VLNLVDNIFGIVNIYTYLSKVLKPIKFNSMYLVKMFTRLLEYTTQKKLAKAQKRSDNATVAFTRARKSMVISNQELQMTQAEVLIQLNKLDQVQTELLTKKALNDRKISALDQFINTDYTIE